MADVTDVSKNPLLISIGVWLIMDISVPSLEKVTVFGVLEIPDTMNATSASITNSSLQYGRVILNATYISIQVRMQHLIFLLIKFGLLL